MESLLQKSQSEETFEGVGLIVEEKEPGVYVRGNRADHELDFLWDRDRKKRDHDKFHVGFFAAGFLSGAVLALLAGAFFLYGNHLFEQFMPPKPTTMQEQASNASQVQDKTPQQHQAGAGFSLPFFNNKPKTNAPAKATPNATPTPETGVQSYVVKSGDTLGSIAIHFYKSSGSQALAKIQEANHMKNANSLQLGQKLVIP